MPTFRHRLSIHPHKNKSGDRLHLFFVVSVNGQRKEIPLGISCPTAAYVKEAMCIKPVPGYDSAPLDNLHLQELIARLNRIFLQLELQPCVPTLSDVLTLFAQDDSTKQKRHSFSDIMDKFISEQSVLKSWSDSTLTKFKVQKRRILEWRSNAFMDEINEDWITAFILHLQKGYTKTLKDGTVKTMQYRNTSLAKLLKNLRWFLNWAKKAGYYQGTANVMDMSFKGGTEPLSDIVFLTADELHTLRDHKWLPSQRHLERVVDVFIFACYCGLRFSDINALRRYHIHDGLIMTSTLKTGIKVNIPLNNGTQSILDKYAEYKDRLNRPFPVISSQKMNDYLKDAARICDINSTVNNIWYQGNVKHEETYKKCDVLSFHCARRTFITQGMVLGIPDSIIIQFTGHTSVKMLKRYQGIADEIKQQQISKFNSL